jgi:hypothetical protein
MKPIHGINLTLLLVALLLFLKGCAHDPTRDIVHFPAGECPYWIEYRWDHGMGVVEGGGCVTLPGVSWVAARCVQIRVDEAPGKQSIAKIHQRSEWVYGEYGPTCTVCNPDQ